MIARVGFRRARATLDVAVILNVSVCAAALAAPADRPNVVFVLADQWRAKALGYEGDPNVQTPNLDRCRSVALTKWLLHLTGFLRPGRPSVHSPG